MEIILQLDHHGRNEQKMVSSELAMAANLKKAVVWLVGLYVVSADLWLALEQTLQFLCGGADCQPASSGAGPRPGWGQLSTNLNNTLTSLWSLQNEWENYTYWWPDNSRVIFYAKVGFLTKALSPNFVNQSIEDKPAVHS